MSSTVSLSQLYNPLNKAQRQIRLVKLTASKSTEDLSCELFLASLDDKPSFKALSYTWGDAANTRTISVNGLSVKIGKNLHEAFQTISEDYHDSIVIWADALCINQNDDEEKTHQVGLMRKIYQDAEEVVVWLGHPPDREKLADDSSFEHIQKVQDFLKELYTQEKSSNFTLVSLPPFTDQSFDDGNDTPLPISVLKSESSQSSEADVEISRKIERTLGVALLRGLVPSELNYWIPDVINDQDRDALTHWLKVKHFGFGLLIGLLPFNETAEQNDFANTVSEHIDNILKLEDSILLESSSRGRNNKGVSWNYNESGAHISKFFLDAFTKALVQPDYHIIGAFCLLGQIANNDHFHELFFFKPENPDHLFYPSMLWKHSITAAVALLQQPYWSRIWIVQEILLSSSTQFRYGKHTGPIQLIVDACLCFATHYRTCCNKFGQPESNQTYSLWGQLTNAFLQLYSFMQLAEAPGPLKIENLLHPKLSFRNATDPRDYVYGILGLVTDGHGVSVVPDYTKSLKDAFIRATLAILEDNDNLDCLLRLEWGDRSALLPTWVPNWSFDGFKRRNSAGGEFNINFPGPRSEHYELFAASGQRPSFHRLFEDSILEVKGFFVDTIVEVFPTIEVQPGNNMLFQIWGVMQWIDGLRKQKDEVDEETFWSTILCGAFRHQDGLRLMVPSDVPELINWFSATFDAISSGTDAPHPNSFISRWFNFILLEKQLFMTKSGRIGLGSARFGHPIREGDQVHILNGFRMPVILRPVSLGLSSSVSDLVDALATTKLTSESSKPLETETAYPKIDSQSFQSYGPAAEVRHVSEPRYEYMSSCYMTNIMQGEMAKDMSIRSSSIFLV